MSDAPPRVDGRLIVGGMAHDFDFARLELLTLLAKHQHARVGVSDSYEDAGSLERYAFLITFTCNVQPTEGAVRALRAFLERGGRWLALHATNSLLDWTEAGVAAREDSTGFLSLLGSQFVAHPPIGRFYVEVSAPEDPLCAGIADFETEDELYLSRLSDDLEVLMLTRFAGDAPGFTESAWPQDDPRPVLYRRRIGAGEVVYCTLGQCRGHYDAPHRTPFYPQVERCSWQTPAFREILRRGVDWAVGAAVLGRENVDGRR